MEARFRWAAGATTWPQIKAKAGFFWGMEIQTAISESSSLQKAFSDLTLHQQRARPPRAVHEHDISFPHCFLPRVSQLPPLILSYHELCHLHPRAHRNYGVLGGHQNETA